MLAGFDAVAAMGDGASDAGKAWVFVRRFVEGWAAPLEDRDGVSREALGAAGVPLPQVLGEMYRLIGRRDDLTRRQDFLLRPGECHWDETGEVLVFRRENQSCAHWGIRRDDLRWADPPVVYQTGPTDRAWLPFLDRVSLAAVEMVLSESLFGTKHILSAGDLTADVLAGVLTRLRPLPFPEYPMWAGETVSPVRWYAAPGLLVRIDGPAPRAWLWAAGQCEEDLGLVSGVLPGYW
ncbi:hypothetical protein ACQEVZ_04035 [Dactylosporangium sp. CA-152071]|uniref:hypothetical protein n=1 Tax=Dactylosporangium sp. CA-152071 TaxID=3239933 RepID=UPI003D903240